MKRVEQAFEILVRLHVADVEDELVLQLVSLGHALHGLFGRRRGEVLVDGVVDDGDLLRRHVEELEDVALGRLGDRQDAIGPPGRRAHLRPCVGKRRPVGQVLRKAQVDAVVDRHDRSAHRQRRQHVVRLVQHVRARAHQGPGNRDLLAQRVGGRGVDLHAEVVAERQRTARGRSAGR